MNERKGTVVILTPGFPANEQDTTCIPFLQDYILALAKLYPIINLKIIAFQYPFKRGYYKWNGIDIYSTGGTRRRGIFRLPVWLRVWKELKQIDGEDGISVIHSFWLTECCLVAQKFANRFRKRHVTYAIGQDVLKTNKYLALLNFKKNVMVIAMSEAIAKRFKNITGQEVQGIISSGIDITKMENTAEKKTIDVIGVGALTPLKNYSLFTEVIASLNREYPKIKACIIGKGEQDQLLRKKIKETGLQNNLELVGEVAHKAVFSYLAKSKIFLHTSGYEGQSTVMMEALAMGLTVVCFDVGRIHVEGKVVVCKDKNEMVQQLKNLLSSEINYTPAITRRTDDMVRDFMKVYEI